MNSHLEKTKDEAMTLWNRAKDDDKQRINKITDEQRRIEEESRAREEILRRGDQERLAQDKLRGEIASNQAEMAGLTQLVQEAQAVQQSVSERDDKNKSLEDKFRKLKDDYLGSKLWTLFTLRLLSNIIIFIKMTFKK